MCEMLWVLEIKIKMHKQFYKKIYYNSLLEKKNYQNPSHFIAILLLLWHLWSQFKMQNS